jgi:hypothetical protein
MPWLILLGAINGFEIKQNWLEKFWLEKFDYHTIRLVSWQKKLHKLLIIENIDSLWCLLVNCWLYI